MLIQALEYSIEVLGEIATFAVAKRHFDTILQSIMIFLNFGLFSPVEFDQNFNILIGEHSTGSSLL